MKKDSVHTKRDWASNSIGRKDQNNYPENFCALSYFKCFLNHACKYNIFGTVFSDLS